MSAVQVVTLILVSSLLRTGATSFYSNELYEQEKTSSYWNSVGLADINDALSRTQNACTAKNVILFIGDGMGIAAVTAGRIFKGQRNNASGEEGYLVMDRLPNIALLKTYNVDLQVPDSAGTATAYLTGVKANHYTVGVTAAVYKNDCPSSVVPENRAHSIMKWGQDAGKHTGIVTTTRITHATPAAAYAASANRDWECDSKLAEFANVTDISMCKDIARQLVEDLPGKDLKVIMGGGRRSFGEEFSSSVKCRDDGKHLATEWLQEKHSRNLTAAYATNTKELRDIDLASTEHIMGLFADSHMSYERARDTSEMGQPSLKEMTQIAIRKLKRADQGFVLLVEGGRIDHALHDSRPQIAVEEVVAFDEAIEAALKMVDLQDTLVIVTADHSHGLTINGYPERGNDILGKASYKEVTDSMPFTTLLMSNGPGYNYTYDGEKVMRQNVTGVNTRDSNYLFQAAIPTTMGWSLHSGEDIAVFAAGPWAHLFHRVHEQNYVAHVMGYSAAIGPYNPVTGNRPIDSSATCGVGTIGVNYLCLSLMVLIGLVNVLIDWLL